MTFFGKPSAANYVPYWDGYKYVAGPMGSGGSGGSFVYTFDDGYLTIDGYLLVNHNLSSQYVVIATYDDNNNLIVPDFIIADDANNCTIGLNSFRTLSGIWNTVIISGAGLQGPTGPTGSGGIGVTGTYYSDYLFWNDSTAAWEVGSDKVHIGYNAGATGQNNYTVAIGYDAGQISQSIGSIAIGAFSGTNNQNFISIAIGAFSGNTNQKQRAIAIGSSAGMTGQNEYAIAIGSNAGSDDQGKSTIAIGREAGYQLQLDNSIAIGSEAGRINQGTNAIAIGNLAGQNNQPNNSIVLNASGYALSPSNSGLYASPIRTYSSYGHNSLFYNAIDNEIFYASSGLLPDGYEYSNYLFWNDLTSSWEVGRDKVHIGSNAGQNSQQTSAISIGLRAGQNSQYSNAIAIGTDSGNVSQSYGAIAIGINSGTGTQGTYGIAIGSDAGYNFQGASSIAIGNMAGNKNQGQNSIAIGSYAGQNNQPNNSIVLNASALELSPINNGLYVNPIRNIDLVDGYNNGYKTLYYNTSNYEIVASAPPSIFVDFTIDGDLSLISFLPAIFDAPKFFSTDRIIKSVSLIRRTAGTSGSTSINILIDGVTDLLPSGLSVSAGDGNYAKNTANISTTLLAGSYIEARLDSIESGNPADIRISVEFI